MDFYAVIFTPSDQCPTALLRDYCIVLADNMQCRRRDGIKVCKSGICGFKAATTDCNYDRERFRGIRMVGGQESRLDSIHLKGFSF